MTGIPLPGVPPGDASGKAQAASKDLRGTFDLALRISGLTHLGI
jgi:hypothetical protein